MRVVDFLERDARLYSHKPAVVIVGGSSVTYGELRARVGGLAMSLAARGVERGDRVVVMAGNNLTPFDVYLACAYVGAAAVPINTRLAPPEIEYIVGDAEPVVALADSEYADMLSSVLPSEVDLVSTAEDEYRRMLDADEDVGIAERSGDQDIVLIIYTSGTTGRPKGVCLTQTALAFNAVTTAVAQGFVPSDVFMSMTPLYHAATGTRVSSMLIDGQTHVVMPSFDAYEALRAIEEYRVTTTIAVPTQLRRMLDVPSFGSCDLSSLRLLVYGAAPTELALIRRAMRELPCGLYQGYGLTEAVTNLTGLLPSDHTLETSDERLRSAGRPVPGVAITVRDEEDRVLPTGKVGEICVRTDKIMAGYWRNEAATKGTVVDGWLHTGDLGREDADGYLTIVDRAKDMLISGGVNVYPSEIEAVIRAWPGVAEVAVVARPDEEWGEVPVAFVIPEVGAPIDEDGIRTFCQERLAKFKVPRDVYVVREFPRTSSGKVRKVDLREQVAERTRAHPRLRPQPNASPLLDE